MLFFENARSMTMAGAVFENASFLIKDGLIAQVGTGLTCPEGAKVIDFAGKTLTPG